MMQNPQESRRREDVTARLAQRSAALRRSTRKEKLIDARDETNSVTGLVCALLHSLTARTGQNFELPTRTLVSVLSTLLNPSNWGRFFERMHALDDEVDPENRRRLLDNIFADTFGLEGAAIMGGMLGDVIELACRLVHNHPNAISTFGTTVCKHIHHGVRTAANGVFQNATAFAATAQSTVSELKNFTSVPLISIEEMQFNSFVDGAGFGFLVKLVIDIVSYLWQSLVTHRNDPKALASLSNPFELGKLIENAILSVAGSTIGVIGASMGVHWAFIVLTGIAASLLLQYFISEPIKNATGTITIFGLLSSGYRGLGQAIGLRMREEPVQYRWAWEGMIEPTGIHKDFLCPISCAYPPHPCFLFGHVYDRPFLEEWLREVNRCPLTNQAATVNDIVVCTEYIRVSIEYGIFRGGIRVADNAAAAV